LSLTKSAEQIFWCDREIRNILFVRIILVISHSISIPFFRNWNASKFLSIIIVSSPGKSGRQTLKGVSEWYRGVKWGVRVYRHLIISTLRHINVISYTDLNV